MTKNLIYKDKVSEMAGYDLVGNLVPRNFFVTSGVGQSKNTVHAGSFHVALRDARIEPFNIQTYSSILPAVPKELSDMVAGSSYTGNGRTPVRCEEISIEDGLARLVHGQELQTIMANGTVKGNGKRITVGIVYDRFVPEDGIDRGGLVCEYSNEENPEEQDMPEDESMRRARDVLLASLEEVHANGDWKDWGLENPNVVIKSYVPTEKYGSALVALCFVDFLRPVYGSWRNNGGKRRF